MKKLALLAAIVLAVTSTARGEDLSGDWQGSTPPGAISG